MRRVLASAVTGVLLAVCAAPAVADVFTDGTLTVDMALAGETATGTFTLNGQTYPATAKGDGDTFSGTFTVGTDRFAFTASIDDNGTLTLVTDGRTYTLKPAKPKPTNPLAAAAPNNPLAGKPDAVPPGPAVNGAPGGQAAPAGDVKLPAGYRATAQTESGLAVRATRQAADVRQAMAGALPDAAALLDGPPTVGHAAIDNREGTSAVALFTGTRGGKPVRGLLTCTMGEGGADTGIIVCDANAPDAAWQKLANRPNEVQRAAGQVRLRELQFPDGTGSIGVPEGWTTNAQTMIDPIRIEGPGGEVVAINGTISVCSPNGQLAQSVQRLNAQARQMGLPERPMPPFLFAEYCSPADALMTLVPMMSERNRQNNGPTAEITKMIDTKPAVAQMPNGRSQLLEYTWVRTLPGQEPVAYHSILRCETFMVGGDSWSVVFTELAAPDAIFAKAQPTMLAVLNSGRPNPQQIAQLSQQRNEMQRQAIAQQGANSQAALNRQFAAGQAAHAARTATFDAQNNAWAQNQTLRGRSNDNFVEVIRGTRDVLDTQTGQRTTVDLWNAPGVVQSLNQGDPGRYAELPLRDIQNPLP